MVVAKNEGGAVFATSGRSNDKFASLGLTPVPAACFAAPLIQNAMPASSAG